MRKVMIIGFCLVAALCFATPTVFADTTGEAIAHAAVHVFPNITVDPRTVGADMGAIQTGQFSGLFGFRVDANEQYVNLQIIATKLYKGDEPTSEFQIPVYTAAGVIVDPACAVPQTLAYQGTGDPINGMASEAFVPGVFESGQNSHFSCDIDVTVSWDQIDAELPQGDYSGYVKLVATIEPQVVE